MEKQGTAGIPCTWCDRDALPNSDPPACELHAGGTQSKRASEELPKPETLKELDSEQGHKI